jgi:hypothetical protein
MQSGVPVATLQNLLNSDPRQDPGTSLAMSPAAEGGTGKLTIIPGSRLDRTLTEMCAKVDDTPGYLPAHQAESDRKFQARPVKSRQIRTLVKVLLHRIFSCRCLLSHASSCHSVPGLSTTFRGGARAGHICHRLLK